ERADPAPPAAARIGAAKREHRPSDGPDRNPREVLCLGHRSDGRGQVPFHPRTPAFSRPARLWQARPETEASPDPDTTARRAECGLPDPRVQEDPPDTVTLQPQQHLRVAHSAGYTEGAQRV